MDIYSSTANLVSTSKQDKTLYPSKHSIVQNELGRESKRRKKRGQSGGGYAGMMIVGILNLAMVIAITIISAVYISHLQEHVGRLEQRVEVLEARSCDFDKEDDVKTSERFDKQNDVEYRIKREATDPPIESAHHRAEHHGIASHNIALVYGDPKKIVSEPSDADEHQFTQNTQSTDAAECGILYERADKQKWCTVKNNQTRRLVPRYMTSRYNHKFYYFEKASWMNRTKSVRNYNLTHDGRIEVRQEGIYIVHASIHFTDVGARDHPHYGVYKTDGLGENQKLLSKCVVSLAEKETDEGSGVYPCQAWQLAHLNAGDQVFMSIGGYTWFQVEKETFHLALIKLNDYAL